jgi:F-type H+-transporting ATPase subunit b
MDLLTPGTGLIIWQTFVFVLLIFLLAKLAWKPILNSAEKARQEISRLKSDNEHLLQQAREERDRMLREAREAAGRLKDEIEGAAKKSADKILDDARAAIGLEKNAALRDIKEQVAMFSIEIAEKLLREKLANDKSQRDLVDRYLKDIKVN